VQSSDTPVEGREKGGRNAAQWTQTGGSELKPEGRGRKHKARRKTPDPTSLDPRFSSHGPTEGRVNFKSGRAGISVLQLQWQPFVSSE
jgi:hypothetical protein